MWPAASEIDPDRLREVFKQYDMSGNIYGKALPRREKELVAMLDLTRGPPPFGEEECMDTCLGLRIGVQVVDAQSQILIQLIH